MLERPISLTTLIPDNACGRATSQNNRVGIDPEGASVHWLCPLVRCGQNESAKQKYQTMMYDDRKKAYKLEKLPPDSPFWNLSFPNGPIQLLGLVHLPHKSIESSRSCSALPSASNGVPDAVFRQGRPTLWRKRVPRSDQECPHFPTYLRSRHHVYRRLRPAAVRAPCYPTSSNKT